jgi:hypothetical protein
MIFRVIRSSWTDRSSNVLGSGFRVSAVVVFSGIRDDPGSDRIEVNIRDRLPEVLLRVDDSDAVSALPEPAKVSMALVVVSGDVGLETQHRTPERHSTGLDDQVIVLCGALGYVELATGRCVKPGLHWFRTPHNR